MGLEPISLLHLIRIRHLNTFNVEEIVHFLLKIKEKLKQKWGLSRLSCRLQFSVHHVLVEDPECRFYELNYLRRRA